LIGAYHGGGGGGCFLFLDDGIKNGWFDQ
jgi:hypothetical protein